MYKKYTACDFNNLQHSILETEQEFYIKLKFIPPQSGTGFAGYTVKDYFMTKINNEFFNSVDYFKNKSNNENLPQTDYSSILLVKEILEKITVEELTNLFKEQKQINKNSNPEIQNIIANDIKIWNILNKQ